MITRLTPNAEYIARGEPDGTLTVSHSTTSQVQWSLKAHRGPISALEWSPDGTWLASGGHDGQVHVYQTTSGLHCASLDHGQPVRHLIWSPNSHILCAASERAVHLIRLSPESASRLP